MQDQRLRAAQTVADICAQHGIHGLSSEDSRSGINTSR